MAFCTQCGKELQDGLRFCPECGTAVVAEPRSADEPPIATAVKDVADAVESVIPEFPSAGGIVEVLAPAEVGEATLSTWKSVPPAAQAIGAAVGQAQKAAKAAKNSPVAKKSKLPVVLVAVGAAILVAAFALYVVPLFIPHPYDPNSHVALTSDSSSSASSSSASAGSAGASSGAAASGSAASTSATSASASASSAAASASASSASSGSASSASAEGASGGSAASEPSGGTTSASPAAAPPAASTSYSTSERPKIGEFKWMTGETDKGNAPAGAARITDFGKLTGGWKAYMYGGNLERLLNVSIDAGQSGAQVTFDWYYIRDNKQDKAFEDTTASSTFTGTFDGGMLDATGPGRITLTAFWEQDGHQYATGSFMWPSGETEVIALVRP